MLFKSIKTVYLAIMQLTFMSKFMAKKKNKAATFKNENERLKTELNLYKNKYEQAKIAYEQLLHSFKEFQRNRFGSKSERFIDNDLQPDIFAAESDLDGDSAEDDDGEEGGELISIAAHKRSKNKKLPPHLPRREEVIKAKDRICSCGCMKVLVRYETTELLNYIPEVFEIIEQKREVLACPCGCSGSITTAANPPRILPKVMVTESLLANIIVSKFHDRQPLYHLEKKLESRFGIELSRNNQARWVIDTSRALQPLINLMKDEIISYDVASSDATTIQVLKEPNRKPEQKSYLYCMRGGPPDKKVIVYDYNPKEHKQFLLDWFEGFSGYIHVDAQNIFDDLGAKPNIELVYCNAHSRRKFESIAKLAKKDGLAKKAMRYYRKLYKIEDQITKQGYSPEQAYLYRLNEAKPILDEFKTWLDAHYPTTLPRSPLGKAFAYALKHWPGLSRYLDDGRLMIDNNATEREIKPVVMARKNFLFANSVAGVRAICIHMSLIRTAIMYGFDPYHYYVSVMRIIPHCKTVEDYEALLPWNIKIAKIGEIAKNIAPEDALPEKCAIN